MSALGRELPFQALTLRERVIAELSFPLLDKGTDAVTIGDVRQIADRIVALIAEQSEGPTPHELRQRIAEISRGGDIEFGPPTDYDYALADAVLKALGHTQQAKDSQ